MIIELDGSQHIENEVKDETRDRFLQEKGYRILRFYNTDVFYNLESVLDEIELHLRTPAF